MNSSRLFSRKGDQPAGTSEWMKETYLMLGVHQGDLIAILCGEKRSGEEGEGYSSLCQQHVIYLHSKVDKLRMTHSGVRTVI